MHKLSSLALSLSHPKPKVNGTHQLLQTQIILIHYSPPGDTLAILSSGLLKPSTDFPSSTVVHRRIRKNGLIKIHALYWNKFLHWYRNSAGNNKTLKEKKRAFKSDCTVLSQVQRWASHKVGKNVHVSVTYSSCFSSSIGNLFKYPVSLHLEKLCLVQGKSTSILISALARWIL